MTKIVIVGETCTDQYVFGRCDRVCPEAAAICFNHNDNEIRYNVGMAGNVYENLKSLSQTSEFSIDLISPRTRIVKKRFVDSRYNTIVFREDINDTAEKINLHEYDFSAYDVIVFSDYCKGFLSESDIIDICKTKTSYCTVFIDTKKRLRNIAQYIDYIKINNYELKTNIADLDHIRENSTLIVTEGDNGAKLYTSDIVKYYPTKKVLLRDVCGAGDTFLAGLVFKHIETNDIDQAINFANTCAAKAVSQFGVVTI